MNTFTVAPEFDYYYKACRKAEFWEAMKVRLDSLHQKSLVEPFRSVVLALHSNGLLELRDLLP